MNDQQKHRVICALSSLLRDTTAKRLVSKDTRTGAEIICEQIKNGYSEPSPVEVEYYNIMFTEEEVDILKNKLLTLTQEL